MAVSARTFIAEVGRNIDKHRHQMRSPITTTSCSDVVFGTSLQTTHVSTSNKPMTKPGVWIKVGEGVHKNLDLAEAFRERRTH